MNKEKRFYEILKKYGVKEFWATPGLVLSDEHPNGDITVSCSKKYVSELGDDLYELYNDCVEDDLLVNIYVDDFSAMSKDDVCILTNGTEKRSVINN